MSLGEFDLIRTFFTRESTRVPVGTGDDCAVLATRPGMQLATSCDMLVEGRHFLPTVDPVHLGHKALAVNLSDLAACGAEPLAFLLALALPRVDEAFLAGFSRGMLALADEHRCELVGGDTTQGPLTISVTVFGEVPAGGALLRSGARAGDDIWLSGTVGDARLALEVFRGHVTLDGSGFERVRTAMERPEPRVALGMALRGVAHGTIDVSDGLLGDLAHLLDCSKVGATVEIDAVPRSPILRAQAPQWQRVCTLAGGDDYELVFTAPPERADAVRAAGSTAGVAVTRIGRIEPAAGLRLVDASGRAVENCFGSFDHFLT